MMRTLGDALKTLAVFAGLGPLIGLLIFATGSALLAIGSGTMDGFWIMPFLLLYGVIFAHFAGIASAAIAAAVAIATGFILKRMPMWIGPLSGAVSFAFSAFFKMGLIDGPILVADGQNPRAFDTWFALVVAATNIGAAWGSWVIARKWIGTRDGA